MSWKEGLEVDREVEGGSWGIVGSFHDVKRGSTGGEKGLWGGKEGNKASVGRKGGL